MEPYDRTSVSEVFRDAKRIFDARRKFWITAGAAHLFSTVGLLALLMIIPYLVSDHKADFKFVTSMNQAWIFTAIIWSIHTGFLRMAFAQLNQKDSDWSGFIEGFFAGVLILIPTVVWGALSAVLQMKFRDDPVQEFIGQVFLYLFLFGYGLAFLLHLARRNPAKFTLTLKSWNLRFWASHLKLSMVVVLFNLLGLLLGGIGMIFTLPISCLALAIHYNRFVPLPESA